MTQPVSINGGAGIVPTADGKALVVIALHLGGGQVATEPMDPDAAVAFIDRLAATVNETAANARRHNLGLIVPTAGNGHGVNLGDTAALRRQP